jgi:hypothetical protein
VTSKGEEQMNKEQRNKEQMKEGTSAQETSNKEDSSYKRKESRKDQEYKVPRAFALGMTMRRGGSRIRFLVPLEIPVFQIKENFKRLVAPCLDEYSIVKRARRNTSAVGKFRITRSRNLPALST